MLQMLDLTYFLKNNKTLVVVLLTLVVAIKTIMFDQITKIAAFEYFKDHHQQLQITPFLNIIIQYNKGISFGLFNNIEQANIMFGILIICITAGLWIWFIYNLTYFNILPIGWITGGALGNLIDRITREGVIDFIDFHYKNLHYPTFNIADAAIVLGAFTLMFSEVIYKKKL